jgi:hypothetical protein
MHPAYEHHIPDGLLAANVLLSQNSHQGLPAPTNTLHQSFYFAISSTVRGLQFRCYETASDPVVAPSKPTVIPNPCPYQGRALPLSAYAQAGQAANGSPINFALDVTMGFPAGHYLDPQPLGSGNVYQNQAYGNYTFGVYMASAGVSLSTALSGANAYAFFRASVYLQ